jgi:hypothetical protein
MHQGMQRLANANADCKQTRCSRAYEGDVSCVVTMAEMLGSSELGRSAAYEGPMRGV